MKVDVIMPQMGESIQEGTVVRWIKKVGDKVKRDEPILEISTDKVDAEIPSPAAGVLSEIQVGEGKTVEIKTVLGVIETEGTAAATAPGAGASAATASGAVSRGAASAPASSGQATGASGAGSAASTPAQRPAPSSPPAESTAASSTSGSGSRQAALSGGAQWPAQSPAGAPPAASTGQAPPAASSAPPSGSTARGGAVSPEERIRTRSSPLVRRIAQENNVDIASLTGTGIAGRVTKKDILDYLARPGAQAAAVPKPAPTGPAISFRPGERVQLEPLSVMRRKISEHMVASKHTSAHVHSFFEVDYSVVDRIRREKRQAFQERNGVKLTYLPFILHATVEALKAWPVLNASVEGENLAYKKDINLGIAVALDWGLIVPVIKNAEERNLAGLAKAAADLAERARSKKLLPDEVQGGTFTITNPGVFGSLFGTPIINQPQLAILGVGTIERRLKVIEDAIAIRTMGYLAIGFDHRIVDGAIADQFMAHIKQTLETFDPRLI